MMKPYGHQRDGEGQFLIIDKAELGDLVKSKDLKMLQKFEGIRGLAKALQTDLKDGIDSKDTEERKFVFGSNTYKKRLRKGFSYFLFKAFMDLFKILQLVCSFITVGFKIIQGRAIEGWHDGGSICVAIIVNALLALAKFKQEEGQFDRLSKISNYVKTDVLRDRGRRQKISIFDVVVGDVVILNIGDQVPADGLFIDGHSLLVEEYSSVTGKRKPIEINSTRHPFLISGSKVVGGCARMLVLSVGMNTNWGKMTSSKTGDYDEQTPRQSRLNGWTTLIGKFAFVVSLLDLIAIVIRYFTGNQTDKRHDITVFTNTVVAIVEGLLLPLNVSLMYSTKGMMNDKAIVKKSSACEAMGTATVLCTHITGILTINDQMEVKKIWVGLDRIEVDSTTKRVDKKVLELYHQGIGLNTTGSVYKSGNTSEYSGIPTEKAIMSWGVMNLGMEVEKMKETYTIIHVDPFNSEKKRSGVSIKKNDDNTIHVHWKGAAEMVLAMCSNYCQKNGLIKSITDDEKTQLEKIIQGMSASKLRCIAFAHKQISETELKHNENGKTLINEQGLTFLGVVGMNIPCRPGVNEDIKTCRSAGLKVIMITGDNIFTAKSIATEIGILQAGPHVSNNINGQVIEGKEFRNYTEEERMDKVESIRVMARSSPSDKLLMVQCLKKKGHVVAVTGDVINDAPALQEANIGLSKGIEGTEVAKESSDIVILDDDFGSIVKGLRWGRHPYNNIQKFIQFQLPPNLAALTIYFIIDASGRGFPLTTLDMLWVNLIMVALCVLALATQKPTKELMKKPPVIGGNSLRITNVVCRNLFPQSLYQIVIVLAFCFIGRSFFNGNERVMNTMVFNTFVFLQLFNLFSSRKLEKMNVFKGLHKNMLFLGAVGVTIGLQILLMEFVYVKIVADSEKLNMKQWGICIAFAALSCPIGCSVKLIPVGDVLNSQATPNQGPTDTALEQFGHKTLSSESSSSDNKQRSGECVIPRCNGIMGNYQSNLSDNDPSTRKPIDGNLCQREVDKNGYLVRSMYNMEPNMVFTRSRSCTGAFGHPGASSSFDHRVCASFQFIESRIQNDKLEMCKNTHNVEQKRKGGKKGKRVDTF